MDLCETQQKNTNYTQIDVDNLPEELKILHSLFISLAKKYEENKEKEPEQQRKINSKKFTVEQAVDEFFCGAVKKGMLYDLIKQKKIPSVKLSTGKILLDEDTLQEWWDEQMKKSMLTVERGTKANKIRAVKF